MGFYLSENSTTLHKYLDKAHKDKEKSIRKMEPNEFGMIIEFRKIQKSANLCMTELIFTKFVINKLGLHDLFWVSNNFERITHSMFKQRDLLSAANAAFSYLKPDDKEMLAIEQLVKDVRTRIEYLNAVPIPENIKLTPIHDYLTLIGANSFAEEIRTAFPTGKDLYESQENGRMDAYVDSIMKTLRDAGKDHDYEARLSEYVNTVKERNETIKAEKKEEKRKYAFSEAENGIAVFRDRFFKGIRTLDGDNRIGLSKITIGSHLANGARGKFCILSCGFVREKFVYRYMLKSGQMSVNFKNVGLYESFDEAMNAIKEFQVMYPDRAFSAVCI